jgi:hypothetical protein
MVLNFTVTHLQLIIFLFYTILEEDESESSPVTNASRIAVLEEKLEEPK